MIRINGKVIEKNAFPDGTLRVQAIDIPEDTNVIVFTWNYEDDSELFITTNESKYEIKFKVREIFTEIKESADSAVEKFKHFLFSPTFSPLKCLNSTCYSQNYTTRFHIVK